MDAVCPADGERVLVAERQNRERFRQALLARDQQIRGIPQLERGGRVPDVTGGEADMDKARVFTELFLEAREQRDHLVLDALLKSEDPPDIDPRLLADASHHVGVNAATLRVGLAPPSPL